MGWLSSKGKGQIWGKLLRSCAEVRGQIELLFEAVSGVDQSIHVLDGVHVPQGKG